MQPLHPRRMREGYTPPRRSLPAHRSGRSLCDLFFLLARGLFYVDAVERADDPHEIALQCIDAAGCESVARCGFERAVLPVFIDTGTRAFDGVLVDVQQLLHQHDQLDLAALVHTVAGAVLCGMEKAELAFPVAKNVRFEIGKVAHVTDREELTDWYRSHGFSLHSSRSARGSRFIKSTIASRGAWPSNRTENTASTIGMSTPARSASSLADLVVITPSATVSRPASASSRVLPLPISTPSERLRLSCPVHVSTRSPMPASPANVAGSAPSATPSRVISASPLVMRAARALNPSPSPS